MWQHASRNIVSNNHLNNKTSSQKKQRKFSITASYTSTSGDGRKMESSAIETDVTIEFLVRKCAKVTINSSNFGKVTTSPLGNLQSILNDTMLRFLHPLAFFWFQ